MEIVYKTLGELTPYENNPRNNDEAVQYVKNSIEKFGFKVPIVIDKDGVIVAGHTRYKASMELDLAQVPCIVADDLTEEEIRAFRLADNKTAEAATWNMGMLDEELATIGFDMAQFGFDEDDFGLADDEEIIEDDVPEIVETRCQLGDLWQLGNHRLICGDSTDVTVIDRLMDGVKADLVVTDPPYNMGYEGAGNTKDRKSKRILNDKMSEEKFEEFLGDVYNAYFLSMKDGASIYVFYKELGSGVFMRKMRDSGLTYKQELVWVKSQLVLGGSKYQSMYEPCVMGCKGKSIKKWNGRRNQRSVIETLDFMNEDELRNVIKELLADADDIDVLRENKQRVNDLHPTMKPIRLLAKLIKNSSDMHDIVMDLFGGSGSTLIACEQLNRKCYMAELDPHYCDVIIQRWENFTGEQAVKL